MAAFSVALVSATLLVVLPTELFCGALFAQTDSVASLAVFFLYSGAKVPCWRWRLQTTDLLPTEQTS